MDVGEQIAPVLSLWWPPSRSDAIVALVCLIVVWILFRSLCSAHGHNRTSSHKQNERSSSNATNPSSNGVISGSSSGHVVLLNSNPCTPTGVKFRDNSLQPIPFDSGIAHGCYIGIHRPTDDPDCLKSGCYAYSEHMHGRRRLWEFRLQFSLRESVDAKSVVFGVEQDKYVKVPRKDRIIASTLVGAVKRAAPGLYQSYGDDPETTRGELERPHVVFPLWIMDQIIITPEGEPLPQVCGSEFPKLGITKAQNRQAFGRAIDELQLVPGPTYSFGFWCIAQYLDALCWQAPARGLLPAIPLGNIGIGPPAYIAMYTRSSKSQQSGDKRHLDSSKTYIWRVAFWSSHNPPKPSREQELLRGDVKDKSKAESLDSMTEECSNSYGNLRKKEKKFKYCLWPAGVAVNAHNNEKITTKSGFCYRKCG